MYCSNVRCEAPPVPDVAGVQFWAKPLGGGKTAVLFINGGRQPYKSARIALSELNVTATTATVTDVWTGGDAGPVVGGSWSTGPVASLDSRFVVIEATGANKDGSVASSR